jgi:hypothetical protein
MTEADVIQVIYEHVAGLFPKTCQGCGKVFPNYRNYLLNTEHAGIPLSYDIQLNNWQPDNSSGNVALANCRCGSTLAISSKGMPLSRIWEILYWVRMESRRRGVKADVIICYIRDVVEKKALSCKE